MENKWKYMRCSERLAIKNSINISTPAPLEKYLSFFSDISERNNDYSGTLRSEEGEGGGHFFVLEVPGYKSVVLIYVYI